MKTETEIYYSPVSYDTRSITDLMSAADSEASRLVSDGKVRPEPVRELLKAGIVRSYALNLVNSARRGIIPQGDLEERTETANKILAFVGVTVKPNYGVDILRQVVALGEKYGITNQNLTALGNSKYVAKQRGHTATWRATKETPAETTALVTV